MAVWTLDLYDRLGASPIKAGVDFQALTAHWGLNGPGSIEVDLNLYADLSTAKVGEAEFQLRRKPINLVPNASIEDTPHGFMITGSPGWTDNGQSTEQALADAKSWKVTDNSAGVGTIRGIRTATLIPASPGDRFAASCFGIMPSGGGGFRIRVLFRDSAAGLLAAHEGTNPAPGAGVWARSSRITPAAPAGTAYADVYAVAISDGSASGKTYYLDALQLQAGTTLTGWEIGGSEAVVWAGPWLGADVDPRRRGLRCNGEGLFWWLGSRVITSDLVYSALAQHQIAWNLIAHTQAQANGALGFTQGTHVGSAVTRNRFYCDHERPNVAEAIEAFTELDDGFDFEIDPDTRAFNTWTPQRKSSSGISLDGKRLDEVTYVEDVRDLQTYITGIGADDCGPILVDVSDATQAATYGRRHGVVDAHEDTTAEVTAEANEELRATKRPRFDARLILREGGFGAPSWTKLVVGDTLTLADDRGYATFGPKTLRIVGKSVSLDNGLPGQAVIELECSSAVD